MPSSEEIQLSLEQGLINDFDNEEDEEEEEIELQEEEEEEETFIRQSFTSLNSIPINKPQVVTSINSNNVINEPPSTPKPNSQEKSSSEVQKNSSSSSTDATKKEFKKQIKPIYERLVGKPEFSMELISEDSIKKMSMRNVVATWFSRESYLDRAIRIHLRSFRNKLQLELQVINKAISKYRKKITEQLHEFEKQEKQLIAWGLKIALPRFHLQAWYRLERNKLQETIIKLYEDILQDKLNLAVNCVIIFDEKNNKRNNRNVSQSALIPATFNIETVNKFCNISESLQETSPMLLLHSLRLTQLDILCSLATKQFIQLEPNFIFKDREKKLIKILKSYSALPSLRESESLIEKGIDWGSFCHWLSVRHHKLKAIELEFSDFIEDQREMEGRLFFRWYTSVMMASANSMYYQTNSQTGSSSNTLASSMNKIPSQNSINMANPIDQSDTNIDPNNESNSEIQQNLAALPITPTSIKAFIRYFATDVVGNKYDIPKDLINANIQLTENLFYKRIYSLIFRYNDASHRQLDDYWRIQSHRCMYVNPNYYHVPEKYYQSSKWNKDNDSFLKNYFNPISFTDSLQNNTNVPKEDNSILSSSPSSFSITSESILVGGVPVAETRRSRAYSKSSIINSPPQVTTPLASATSSPILINQQSTSTFNTPNKNTPKNTTQSSRTRCSCNYCVSLTMSSRLQRPPSSLTIRFNSLKDTAKFSTSSIPLISESSKKNFHLSSYPSHGIAFSHSIRTLSLLSLCSTPRDLLYTLSLSFKWVLREAHEAGYIYFKEKWIEKNGSEPLPNYSPSIIGADQLVPIFTLVLIHSNIPQLHLLLYIMMRYGEYEEQGDISYNLANLEGSLYFAMSLDVDEYFSKLNEVTRLEIKKHSEGQSTLQVDPNCKNNSKNSDIKLNIKELNLNYEEALNNLSTPIGRRDPYAQSILYSILENDAMINGTTNPHPHFGSHSEGLLNATLSNSFDTILTIPGIDYLKTIKEPPALIKSLFNRSTEVTQEDISSMEELGEWLRDQQNMEDTIAILQKDGWML